MERKPRGNYYPRPSSAGPERCIRQLVFHGLKVPEDKPIGDRFIMTMDDSSWHETLTEDWLRKTSMSIHSDQMALDCGTLEFMPKPTDITGYANLNQKTIRSDIARQLAEFIQKEKAKALIGEALSSEDMKHRISLYMKIRDHNYRFCPACNQLIPINIMHGHIDGILTDLQLTDRMYEHKALSSYGFERIWNKEWPLDYFTQSAWYFKGLSAIIPEITEGLLVVKNKNTSQYLDILWRYDLESDIFYVLEMEHSGEGKIHGTEDVDGEKYIIKFPDMLKSSYEKFEAVHEAIQAKKLPRRPYAFGTQFPCGYCSWEETCWGKYLEEVKGYAKPTPAPEIEELAAMLEDYKAAQEKESAGKKEKNLIKLDILKIVEDKQIAKGVAGGYGYSYYIVPETEIPATVKKEYPVLRVSKRKTPAKKGKK
jgi:hypothetical protein